jgi:hypothetical protein
MKKGLVGVVFGAVVGSAALAVAGGFLTNGLPFVSAPTLNGVAQPFPNGIVTELGAGMLIPVDTQLPNGQAPQSVAGTVFQIAALYGEAAGNTATSTAGAATLNTKSGVITTESLSTAAGSTYSFVLTDSLILSTSTAPQVMMYSKTNTGGVIAVTSVTVAAGSATIVFTNTGTTAFNGTMTIVFHV